MLTLLFPFQWPKRDWDWECPATLPCTFLDGKCGNLVSYSFQIFIFPCLYIQFLQLTRWDLDRVEELLPVLEDASTTSTVKQMSPRPRTNLVCQHQRQHSLRHPSLSTSYGRQSGSGVCTIQMSTGHLTESMGKTTYCAVTTFYTALCYDS